MKKYVLFFITVMISFMAVNVYANEIYYINGTDVRMRSTASTSGDKLLVFPKGAEINVLSTQVTVGAGCSSGWLNVSYNGKTGYVCKEFVSTRSVNGASYGRPWNTPKKSIVGGAEFIYVNYINGGQYNSYLKKFNVNPGSGNVYKNQYMTNLAAPSSEAVTSYNSYSKNGLLDQPLVFEIPVFTNMTDRVIIKNTGVEEMGVEDQNFENYLNGQGFDESYKNKLRVLHKKHPNWVFKVLNTNLDWNNSVSIEANVGAMSNNSGYCAGGPDSVEPGWCISNTTAAAFYLDPRNFLSEKYILQFESLFYSDAQTESVVQTILNNTAMSGISALDNQTFASIFVEAGKKHKVSPVYLASLARQETTNGTGFSARGEAFTYEGIYYDGNLYNYFNIGASGGSNPVLKGLVYASAGYTNNATSSGGSSNVSATSEATYISILGVNKDNNYIKGYGFNTSVDNIKNNVNGRANVVVTNSSGNAISGGSLVGTGSTLTISDGTSSYSYTVVIKGDINGDGNINSADLLKIRQYLVGTVNLSDSFKDSADVNRDGKLNSADLLIIRQQLLGTYNITQG